MRATRAHPRGYHARMKATGLLAVWNRIAPEHEVQFNAWYEAEHLDERMAIPGFHSARRYRASREPHAYAAMYELEGPGVLQTPAYLHLLANPTPRTRSIMPHFLDMNRAACAVAFDSAPGMAPVRHLAILALNDASAVPTEPFDEVRVRLAVPDVAATGGTTPEQQLRGSTDRVPPPFLLVEGESERAVSACCARLCAQLGAYAPRSFTLLSARAHGATSLPAELPQL